MIVYRVMSSYELVYAVRGNDLSTLKGSAWGPNTFFYQKDISYIHFFKFLEHALYFMKYRDDPIIAKIKLPNSIIPNLEYGFYKDVETVYDDSLIRDLVPLPEFIIERDLFQNNFIVDFTNNGELSLEEFKNCLIADFWIEQPAIRQHWGVTDIYYEYIKSLMPHFDYNTEKVAQYLKTINLDEELEKMTEYIKKNQIITIRRHLRRK